MITDITTATPVEIDTEIARIQHEDANAMAKLAQRRKMYDHMVKKGQHVEAVKIDNEIEKLVKLIGTLHNEIAPLHMEYRIRGGWTRAYLVNNSNGHVHNTTRCTTCFASTDFVWLTELSDHDEQEIVDLAGERACTVCYASAPVELKLNQATKLFTPDEKAAQARKAELDAKRAVAAGAKVLNADGKELFKTDRGATNFIASELGSMVHYGPTHPSFNTWAKDVNDALDALVLKGSIEDKDAYYNAALDKARAKVRKEHKAFKKTAQYASFLAGGFVDESTLVEGYDPAKF
jgi:hypothetical protein